MVWVISREDEKTTDNVLEYIKYFDEDFMRVHKDDMINELEITLNNQDGDILSLFTDDKNFVFKNKISTWYRRGDFSFIIPLSEKDLNPKLKKCIDEEWEYIKSFIHHRVVDLGGFYTEQHNNKLKNLLIAKDVGLKIPNTIVTMSKEKLLKFFYSNKSVITKPIHNGHLKFSENNKRYSSKGLLILTKEIIDKSEDKFTPSLFQAYVEKEYEIRIFFLEKELYPMAIFSQADEKTKYDFRNYNNERPNRNVPYKLPLDVEEKILSFIHKTNLNTGSIDMIFSIDEEYVFLEVNPSGQFGWVSTGCNYYLEKKIAKYLISNKELVKTFGLKYNYY